MFHLFGRKKEIAADNQVYDPVDGKVIDITDVDDPVFSGKMMGEGFGVIPESDIIFSPVSGQVMMVADTKHAVGLKMNNGLEVLVHLGVDTVELQGRPFRLKVKKGDILRGGERLGTMDLDAVKEAGKGTTVIVAVTNSNDVLKGINIVKGNSDGGEIIGNLTAK